MSQLVKCCGLVLVVGRPEGEDGKEACKKAEEEIQHGRQTGCSWWAREASEARKAMSSGKVVDLIDSIRSGAIADDGQSCMHATQLVKVPNR